MRDLDFVAYEINSEEVLWLDATNKEPIQLSNSCVKSGGKEGEPLLIEMRSKTREGIAVICVLRPGVQDNMKLDLIIDRSYGLKLHGTTKATVQVAGYKITPDYDDGDEDSEDVEDEDAQGEERVAQDGEDESEDDDDDDDDDDEDDREEDGGVNLPKGKGKSNQKQLAVPGQKKEKKEGDEDTDNDSDSEEAEGEDSDEDSDEEKDSDEEAEEDEVDGDVEQHKESAQAMEAASQKRKKPEVKAEHSPAEKKRRKTETTDKEKSKETSSVKPGSMRTLPFGLQLQEILVGTGALARPGHLVSCHYTLRLENGKKVDSSGKKPFKFRLGVGEVIKGWDLGVKGMRVGGERHLIVPPKLGYGAKGAGAIPGNAKLLFDIKLADAQ